MTVLSLLPEGSISDRLCPVREGSATVLHITDSFLSSLFQPGAMRTSEFDSSSEEEEVGEEQLTPFNISW